MSAPVRVTFHISRLQLRPLRHGECFRAVPRRGLSKRDHAADGDAVDGDAVDGEGAKGANVTHAGFHIGGQYTILFCGRANVRTRSYEESTVDSVAVARVGDHGPKDRRPPMMRQYQHPIWRLVHFDQESYGFRRESGTSRSPAYMPGRLRIGRYLPVSGKDIRPESSRLTVQLQGGRRPFQPSWEAPKCMPCHP